MIYAPDGQIFTCVFSFEALLAAIKTYTKKKKKKKHQ